MLKRALPPLRADLESVLREGETQSDLLEATVRQAVERRRRWWSPRCVGGYRRDAASCRASQSDVFISQSSGVSQTSRRELVVRFGASGDVPNSKITSVRLVMVLAARNRHEDDFHWGREIRPSSVSVWRAPPERLARRATQNAANAARTAGNVPGSGSARSAAWAMSACTAAVGWTWSQ